MKNIIGKLLLVFCFIVILIACLYIYAILTFSVGI